MSAPATVHVLPTETVVLAAFDVSIASIVSLQVTNLDGSQTFDGTVYVALGSMSLAPTPVAELTGVGPGVSRVAQVDVRGVSRLELRGVMSGVGGDVSVAAA